MEREILTNFEFGFYQFSELGSFFNLKEGIPYFQLYWFDGEGRYWVDSISYQIMPYDIHLVTPGAIVRGVENITGYAFVFSNQFLQELELQCGISLGCLFSVHALPFSIPSCPKLKDKIRSYTDLIVDELESNGSREAIIKLISIVFSYIFNCEAGHSNSRSIDSERVCQLIKLIDIHFLQEQGATFYASQLSISERSLSRMTKVLLGQTVTQLIQKRLMVEARKLIVSSNKPIKEIAFSLGYSDNAYFSRVFKKWHGVSALDFKVTGAKLCNLLVGLSSCFYFQ